MITLSNDYSFQFVAASGSLGFDGLGYVWEWPLRWLGLLDPSQFTIISKTLTLYPTKGNLRWYAPWRCVRPVKGGYINSVGLTNGGLKWWLSEVYPRLKHPLILSLMAHDEMEAYKMTTMLSDTDKLLGVEINLSCPNTTSTCDKLGIVRTFHHSLFLPIIVKLGESDLELIPYLEPYVDCFDLINTIPWTDLPLYTQLFPSPLARYGLIGGVSGEPIRERAEEALLKARGLTTKPIISGGGVWNLEDVKKRFTLGADAVAFGSIFLRSPWLPNKIIRQWRQKDALHRGIGGV